jgi:hypothetical protein
MEKKKKSMELYGLSIECHGVPWSLYIPWTTLEFHGLPWNSKDLYINSALIYSSLKKINFWK